MIELEQISSLIIYEDDKRSWRAQTFISLSCLVPRVNALYLAMQTSCSLACIVSLSSFFTKSAIWLDVALQWRLVPSQLLFMHDP